MPAQKSTKKASYKKPPSIIRPLYAVPIYEAIDAGNLPEMRKMATQARKHVREVESALATLEKKIK